MKKRLIKKLVSTFLIFFVLFLSFGEMSVVFAETPAQTSSAADIGADLAWTKMLSQVRDAFNAFLYPILLMTGALIENDLLFGSGMEFTLTQIWIPIRNLVNILFVIVLIGIALYNVLGLGEEGSEYAIKSALPKIVAALIIINFSFLGIKVMLDGVNALTTAILALPNDMGQKPAGLSSLEVIKYCEGVNKGVDYSSGDEAKIKEALDLAAHRAIATRHGAIATIGSINEKTQIIDKTIAYYTELKKKDKTIVIPTKADLEKEVEALKDNYHCNGVGLTKDGEAFFATFNSRNAAAVLALNMTKFSLYDVPDVSIKDGKKLATNAIFSLILSVVLVASFVALFIVLLYRIVFMWVAIAISPILILILFAPSIKDKFGGLGDIGDKFMKNAIAPIPIALALAIGWIMLKALQTTLDADQVANLGMNPGLGIPVTGLGTPQELMIMIGTITVIWLGVFSATEGTLAEGVTGAIKETVQKVGKGIGTMPIKHLPTGVTHKGKDVKLGALGYALQQVPEQLNRPMTEFSDSFTGQKSVTTQELTDLKGRDPKIEEKLRNILARANDGNFKDKNFQRELNRTMRKLPAGSRTKTLIQGSGYLGAGDDKKRLSTAEKLKKDLQLPSTPRGVAPVLQSTTPTTTKVKTKSIQADHKFKSADSAGDILTKRDLTFRTGTAGYKAKLDQLGEKIDKVKTNTTANKTAGKTEILKHIETDLKIDHNNKTYLPSAAALKHSMGDRYSKIVGKKKLFKTDADFDRAIRSLRLNP